MLIPPDPLTASALLKALGAYWTLDKVTGGIVSEYAKKFWFKRIHKQKDKTEILHDELRQARDRYNNISNKVDAILRRNDSLEGEVIQLRVDNARLSQQNTIPEIRPKPPSDRPGL
jgi:hypothetical protein